MDVEDRDLDQAEKDYIQSHLPNTNPDQCRYRGPPSGVYNCIAYSMGRTDRWIDPPLRQADFEALYLDQGFELCNYHDPEACADGFYRIGPWTVLGEFDLLGGMKHGSRILSINNGEAESKLGTLWKMSHPRGGLDGGMYGNVVMTFRSRPNMVIETPPTSIGVVSQSSQRAFMTIEQALRGGFPTLTGKFEERFSAWKGTWFSPAYKGMYQSSMDRANGEEWDNLVALGPRILPNIIGKLQIAENLFAIQLYNKIQTDATKKVSAEDVRNYYILNYHVKHIQWLYAKQFDDFLQYTAAWKTHQENVAGSSNSEVYFSCVPYDALVGMGMPIIALIMHHYLQDQAGWWYGLLDEIVNGRRSRPAMVRKPEIYRQWEAWYSRV